MKPRLTEYARGGFSSVFDVGGGRVLKAYRRAVPEGHNEVDSGAIPMLSFLAEKQFYEHLSAIPELAGYCPQYFGPADPAEYHLDVDDQFVPACAILLEKIPGEPVKLAHLETELCSVAESMIEDIRAAFKVEDPWDGSAFVVGPSFLKLIDLATPTEKFVALDEHLARNGVLRRNVRIALGL